MKNMTHSDGKVIWIADEKLFRVFDLGVAIHGSEFVCFLDTFILREKIFESHEELCKPRTAETFLAQFLVTVTRGFGLLPTSKNAAAHEGKKRPLIPNKH